MMHSLIQVSSGRNKVLEHNHSPNMSGNWETLEGRITEDGQLEHTLLSNQKMSPPNEKKPQCRSSPCLDFCHFGGRALCLVAHTLGKNTQLQIIKSFPARFAPAYKTAGSTPCAGINLNESRVATTLVGRTSTVLGTCGNPQMKGIFFHKLLVGGQGYVPGLCWKILRLV